MLFFLPIHVVWLSSFQYILVGLGLCIFFLSYLYHDHSLSIDLCCFRSIYLLCLFFLSSPYHDVGLGLCIFFLSYLYHNHSLSKDLCCFGSIYLLCLFFLSSPFHDATRSIFTNRGLCENLTFKPFQSSIGAWHLFLLYRSTWCDQGFIDQCPLT